MAATTPHNDSVSRRVYNLQTPSENKAAYDEWAPTYEKDLLDPSQDYVAPAATVQAVLAVKGNLQGSSVLDVGCGTGLVGVALREAGVMEIDGTDISTGMLEVAEKTGVYRSLGPQDLSVAMEQADESYDVVTCVGTLTQGHVGPVPALREFVRVVKAGGVVAATVLDSVWESGGYADEVRRLETEGVVEVVGTAPAAYRRGAGVEARILVMKKR